MAPFLGHLIETQRKRSPVYVEPFAGGAGAALRLLVDEYVDYIELNDIDPGVAAFWRSVFFETEALIERVRRCPVNLKEWSRQRAVYEGRKGSVVDLGFATFFLNRTNRSGILSGRPIGGLNQTGKWPISARFHRDDLVARIRLLGRFASRVKVHNQDGIAWLHRHIKKSGSQSFYYVDPPYLNKGRDLYLDTLTWHDHQRLARLLNETSDRWVVTYDCDRRVPDELYRRFRIARFAIAHTAANQHVGWEFAVFSRSLRVDGIGGLSTSFAELMEPSRTKNPRGNS